MLNLVDFLITMLFNLYWLIAHGLNNYIKVYNGDFNKWLSVGAWLYSIFGVVNLIIYLK